VLSISAAPAAQGMMHSRSRSFPLYSRRNVARGHDGRHSHGWRLWLGLHESERKLWYNLTITAASVLIALLIGSIEALGLLAAHFGLSGASWIQ
jgi:nickel/cobalt transporter (NiCoT) family protein